MRSTTVAVLSMLLASCASMPSSERIAAAAVGRAPTQEEAQLACVDYFNASLKDPESAHYRFGSISKGAYKQTAFSSPRFAWRMNVWCNAKNSFGGYVGDTPYLFFFLGTPTHVVAVSRPSSSDPSIWVLEEQWGGGMTAEEAGL